MTLNDLSQLYWLKKEISCDEKRLRQMDADRSDECEKLKIMIGEKKQRCITEQARIEKYITSIDDSLTRQIFIYRFVCCMSWVEVSMTIGGGNTPESVKKRCQRWIRKHSIEPNKTTETGS